MSFKFGKTSTSSSKSDIEGYDKYLLTDNNSTSIVSAANDVLGYFNKKGKKDTTFLVKLLEDPVNSLTQQEFYDLFWSTKRISLSAEKFDEERQKSLDEGKKKMVLLGMDEKKISISKPRVVFSETTISAKHILEKYFWGKVQKEAITWGSLSRTERYKKFCNELKIEMVKYRPPTFEPLFCKMFWMNLTFSEAENILLKRVFIFKRFLMKCKEANIAFEITGSLNPVSKALLVKMIDHKFKPTDIDVDISGSLSEIDIMTKEATLQQFLAGCVLPSPVLLMQTSDLRQQRKRGRVGAPETNPEMLHRIYKVLDYFIVAHHYILKVSTAELDNIKRSLDPKSAFMQKFFKAHQFLRQTARDANRIIYGSGGNANTRFEDLSYEVDQEWETAHEFFKELNPNANLKKVAPKV